MDRRCTRANAFPAAGWILAVVLLFGAGGCATAPRRGAETYTVPRYADAPPAPVPPPGASLWNDRKGAFFADRRARTVNDVVTVTVDESAKASKEANTSLGRESTADLGISAFFGLEKSLASRNGNLDPAGLVKADGSTSFDGSGKTSREETLSTTVTAVVRELLPNGNMVIEARRQISVNGENQVMVLHGVIRPEDVDGNNSVPSSRVAQARIEYFGEGVISERQTPGWMARLIERFWPF
ncbi:MAG: flagellar basal body L-ring protein FlgH [Deltaproteobacteria bacterium]